MALSSKLQAKKNAKVYICSKAVYMNKCSAFLILILCLLFEVKTSAIGFESGAPEYNDNTDISVIIARINCNDVEITIPSIIYTFTDTDIKLKFKNPEHTRLLYNNNKVNFIINGEEKLLFFQNGECHIKKRFQSNDERLTIYAEMFSYKQPIHPISIWYFIIPILLLVGAISWLIIKIRNKKHSALS